MPREPGKRTSIIGGRVYSADNAKDRAAIQAIKDAALQKKNIMMTSKESEVKLFSELSDKELIYNQSLYFKESQRQEVQKAHFDACFREIYQHPVMRDIEKMEYDLHLYQLIESYPDDLLFKDFPFVKKRSMVDGVQTLEFFTEDEVRLILYNKKRKFTLPY